MTASSAPVGLSVSETHRRPRLLPTLPRMRGRVGRGMGFALNASYTRSLRKSSSAGGVRCAELLFSPSLHAGKGREEGPCHGLNPFCYANGRNHRATWFRLGRLHIELPNRGGREGGRPRAQ